MPWMRYIPQEMHPKNQRSHFAQNASVKLTGGTTGDCINTPVEIRALRTGAIAKVPVILAELTLQLNLDAKIDLPVVASEINIIKNSVKVSQCLLLSDTNMLFIKGYVSQNIEYKAISSIYGDQEYGSVSQCAVEVPFGCTTSVDFNGSDPLDPIPNDIKTFEYQNKQNIDTRRVENNPIPHRDFLEKNRISTEHFNDLPYCELVSTRIIEADKCLSNSNVHRFNTTKEKYIKNIEEKMVIYLTIKILQNQQIEIFPMALRAVLDKDS